MSKYRRTKLLPRGLQFIQGVVKGNTRFEITGASFGTTQVSDNDVANNRALPNVVGHIPIVAIDNDSLASQGVLGIELSFTQASTGIDHDVALWDVQIEGQQERSNQQSPIAYTIADEPEQLTLSDPSFEFRLMVYVQVGDTDKVTINVNPDGMESRAEHERDLARLIRSISEGYVDIDLKDSNGNQLYDHDGKIIKVKHAIVNTDKSLTIPDRAADAKKVGKILTSLDEQLRKLDSLLHTDYSTKLDLQNVKNTVLYNSDVNRHQDDQINSLINKTADIENGAINNTRSIRILGHDGRQLSTHTQSSVVARTQYVKIDSSLTDYNAVANAGAVGATIRQAFLILSASINQLVLNYNSLESNQTIVDIKNRLAFLEDQKNKENNK